MSLVQATFPSAVCFVCLRFYFPDNSYGPVETVSSPNHTFSWASLTKQLTSTYAHTLACNFQQPFLNQRKEKNDRRNYFMIDLHKSMGTGGKPRNYHEIVLTQFCSQATSGKRLGSFQAENEIKVDVTFIFVLFYN